MTFNDKFRIKCVITNYCNFGCDYCTLHGENTVQPSFESFKTYLNIVNDALMQDFTKLEICVTGGEPTQNKDYNKIMEYILTGVFDHLDVKLKTYSNFSRPDKIKKFLEFYKNSGKKSSVFLRLSFHADENKYNLERFVNNILDLQKISDTPVFIIYFMLENNPRMKECIDWLSANKNIIVNNKIRMVFRGISNNPGYYDKFDSQKYLEDSLDITQFNSSESPDDAFDITAEGNQKFYLNTSNKYTHYKCNAVIDAVQLLYDGTIFPCPNVPGNGKSLGNLNNVETQEKLKQIKKIGYYFCPYDFCARASTFNHPEPLSNNTPYIINKR